MCYFIVTRGNCQDILTNTTKDSSLNLTPKQIESYTTSIDKKAASISKQVEKANTKALKDLQQQEEKLQKKLAKVDSNLAKQVFANSSDRLQQLTDKLQQKTSKFNQLQTLTSSKDYLPLVDTFATSLKFLEGKLDASGLTNQATKALSSVKGLESQLQNATEIKDYIQQQKQAIQAAFGQYNLGSSLQSFNKQAYYYQQQIQEYKQLLKNPDKLEKRAIAELTKSAFFKDFMQHNSQLASLFPMPQGYGTAQALAGLQTRASVNQILQSRLGTIPSTITSGGGQSPQSYLQQQIQQGQNQLNALKEKINKAGGSSSDLNMPDGFKPNTQKTKRFLDRLEYGLDVQTQKQNSLFPLTSDIGFSVGYKLNDNNSFGIGASYKMGWGSGLDHIKLTNEGIGLRSYLDMKLKGSLFISGGYEQNYQQRFGSIGELYRLPQGNWRQSALLGLSKKIPIVKNKTSKVQILYDFLCKQNHLQTQPLVFRVGWGM
ncbi:hypothetical protein ACFOW1_06310 [Parasediminibacterium paludis]|uniref:Autotransporter domain-containing protein n=1 Tax=Parasediminibacterium paludis TaxID=908966 RepID=A0ABV8PU28_9BACT